MYGLFWHRKLATLVLMGILIFMIFTSFSSSTQDKTYSSKYLSFNYPKTWSIDENSVIRTGNDGIGKIEKLGSIKDYAEYYMVPATLDGIATHLQNHRLELTDRVGTYDRKEITNGNVHGIQFIPRSSNKIIRADYYFAKGDTAYHFYLTSPNFELDREGFDTVINSIQIHKREIIG